MSSTIIGDDPMWSKSIVEEVYRHYESLPKMGKPREPGEWTTLASFIIVGADRELEVVCCATGTRCLGKSLLDKNGNRLHDSHAEVLARRGFQCYLMAEIAHAYKHCESRLLHLNENTGRVQMKPGIQVIFFTSQTPCGDAAIFPRAPQDIHPEMKRKFDESINSTINNSCDNFVPPDAKRLKHCMLHTLTNVVNKDSNDLSESEGDQSGGGSVGYGRQHPMEDYDLYRTGAKCVPGGPQDQLSPGSRYHVTGVLRTKPGRGDPTHSMSCSDKMARWNILGCQGCFPMVFLESPIYIEHIVISGCSVDREAMVRAMYGRFSHLTLPDGGRYKMRKPEIYITDNLFTHSKRNIEEKSSDNTKVSPSSTSLIWYKVAGSESTTDVAVDGYRQGVTKKSLHSVKARLSVCRSNMLIKLHDIFNSLSVDKRTLLLNRQTLPRSYQACKDLVNYTTVWRALADKDNIFKLWLRKERNYSSFELNS